MIRKSTLLLFFVFFGLFSQAQLKFNNYFQNNCLRVDYIIAGSDTSEYVLLKEMKKEPHFAGSHTNLLDKRNYGTYRYQVFDLKSDSLIYSKGFCPLFQEWQTTAEASEINRGFYQVAILPFPKRKIRFSIEKRNWEGDFESVFSVAINPNNYFIINENLPSYEVVNVQDNGAPKNKVDVVFLPEGYAEWEMDKFMDDVERMTKKLFKTPPFDKHKNDFNIYAVMVPSEESGTDVPGEKIYKNTAFNSTFYTFDTPRYLTASDMKSIHDAAAVVPYDHIYLLVNTDRYGGGGFYNYLSVTSVDHELTPTVFTHEFGHGFAGLADEYYSSNVAYDGFYNLEVEPWEPNITTMVNFESKWKNMLNPNDSISAENKKPNRNEVGLFEGGGYVAKGIFRPVRNCRMKSNEAKGFCPVCQQAIVETIKLHCK